MINMKRFVVGLLASAALFAGGHAFGATAPQQCVTNAVAGGTADAITVPLLPCGLATNILILTITANNTTQTPTLQMAGFPAQRIYTNTLQNPGIGDFGGAGSVLMLASTGTSWLVINGNVGGYIPIPLSVTNGGTGVATITSHGIPYGNGTSAIGVTAAGLTGQYLAGSTGSAPTWGTLASSLVTTLSFGSTGLTPNSATSGAISVAGTLVVSNGGTGDTSLTSHGLLYGNGSSAVGITAACITGEVVAGVTGSAPVCSGLSNFGVSSVSMGSTGFTPSTNTAGIVTVAGIANISSGGTGVSLAATGGISQVLKQTSVGGNVTVARLACSDLSDSGSGCSGTGTSFTAKTSNYNASASAAYCNDTVTGTATITATLPASPANNDSILFLSCSNYSTYNFIVARNGNNIQGLAQDLTVATNNAAFSLVFITSYGWRMY